MEPNGSLKILTQDSTGVKRYTITPGAGTSMASLIDGAGTQHQLG